MKKFILSLFCIASCFSFTVSAQEEVLNNDAVIALASANLNSAVVVNKIRASKTNFDLSVDALIKLKNAGIGDEIIHAMLEAQSGKVLTGSTRSTAIQNNPNDPLAPHDYGIYLYDENNSERKLTRLTPNVSDRNRTVGEFTSRLVPFGLGVKKIKAELDGTAAELQTPTFKPVFYFYLDAKSGGLNGFGGIPANTSEFSLVEFSIHDGNRQITISRKNAYKEKSGLQDKNTIQFTAEDLGNGIFKVTPNENLKSGEYGFFLINSGISNTGNTIGAKFFDFGVKIR